MNAHLPTHFVWIQTESHGSLHVEFFNALVIEADGYEQSHFGIAAATRKGQPVDLAQSAGAVTLKTSLEQELVKRFRLPRQDYVWATKKPALGTIQIVDVNQTEVEDGCFVVEAKTIDGRIFRHQGPKGFVYFTAEQAERLVWRVVSALCINPQFWDDGTGGYYGTAAHEYALLEAEYYEG